MAKKTEKLKKKLRQKPTVEKANFEEGLSFGSTLVNLACSGRPNVAIVPGKYYYFVGDPSSCKTFLMLTLLAEATISPLYKNHRFIYDGPEDGDMMDKTKFFGKKMAERLEFPAYDKYGQAESSLTIEDFYYNLEEAYLNEKPFIYILDSMDGLTCEDEDAMIRGNLNKRKNSKKKNKAVKMQQSMGLQKPKANSKFLARIVNKMKRTKSILIIISQTRQNIGNPYNPKTRAGGKSLTFYSQLEVWTSVNKLLKKEVNDKPRHIGNIVQVHTKRNRLTGKDRKVKIAFYFSYGIDDLGSCVDWLVEENHWKKKKGIIDAKEFKVMLGREKLVKHIEESGSQESLRMLVTDIWQEIEEGCKIERQKRYE